MKMKYALVIFLNLFSAYSFAQNLYISSGVTRSGMSVVYNDDYEGLGNFKEISRSITIDLLFEIKLGNHVALKTGPCLLNKSGGYKFTYIDIDGAMLNGVNRRIRKNCSYEFSYLSIDYPVLFTYNLIDPEKKFRINLNIGPYLGRFMPFTFFPETDAPGEATDYQCFDKFDYGYYASAGIGFRKWQLGCFMSKGLSNISNTSIKYNNLIRVKSNITGITLSRVINFSKKDSESKKK
jgi:hypothetical protein